MIADDGLWQLRFAPSSAKLSTIAKALRDCFGLTPHEALAKARDASSCVYEGTISEAEWYAKLMQRRGVLCQVLRVR